MTKTCLQTLILGITLVAQGAWAEGIWQPTSSTAPVMALELVETFTAEAIDLEAILSEDLQREEQGLPLRFAVPETTLLTPWTHGDWEVVDKGTMIWRLRIEAPEASSINLGFGRYFMPDGGRLLIHSPDGEKSLRPFTAANNKEHGELWTPVVPASELVLEVTVAKRQMRELELDLTAVNSGYRPFLASDENEQGSEKSGSCNVDVVCSEGDGWREQIRSVGVYTLNGTWKCTGALVNNTLQDFTPYFLTANHCGITTSNDASMVVYWGYQNRTCRTPGSSSSGGNGNGWLGYSQSGATLRANYAPSDFALVELDDDPDPSFNVYWAGWDSSTGNPSQAIAIHHPSTDEKRISFEYNATTTTSYLSSASPGDGTHIRVADWDLGTTEPGSSGSPLFNPGGLIVGQLHGGDAACGNNESDWYGRLSYSWNGGGASSNRLSTWLDSAFLKSPALSGINKCTSGDTSISVHGLLSCMGEGMNCQVLRHECLTESGTVVFSGGGVSGSPWQSGWRCGDSSSQNHYTKYIEVYVNDDAHTWSWPDDCVKVGSTFNILAGNTYNFRGPSFVGGTAQPFTVGTPPPLSVYITRAGLWNPPQTMTAHVSGGVAPYSYAWYRKPVCGGGLPEDQRQDPDGSSPLNLPDKDVPCTGWYGPFSTTPPHQWTPYQGPNQNIRVTVTDSLGATKTAYSWAN